MTMLVGGAATMDLISTAANAAAFWVDVVAAPLLAVFPVPDEP